MCRNAVRGIFRCKSSVRRRAATKGWRVVGGYAGGTDMVLVWKHRIITSAANTGPGGLFSVVVKRSGVGGRAGRKTLWGVGCRVACGQEEKRMQGRAMGNGRGM